MSREFDENYEITRQRVLKRDKHKCVLCGSRKKLQVHHIITYADCYITRDDEKNLCVLCKICHKEVSKNEKNYAIMLINIVLEKYK